jgi:hypothetical membrane protein
LKRYPYFGIAAVVVSYFLIGLSIVMSPWFSWTNNALSDLGNTAKNALGPALVFDIGLTSGGLLALTFIMLHLKDARYHWKYLVWGIPLAFSSVFLTLIGIFNESFGSIHLIVSVGFFFMTTITLLAYSYISYPLGAPRIGAIALILGVFCAIVWIARFPWQGVAIQETVTSVASAIFVMLIARRVIKWPNCVTENGRAKA